MKNWHWASRAYERRLSRRQALTSLSNRHVTACKQLVPDDGEPVLRHLRFGKRVLVGITAIFIVKAQEVVYIERTVTARDQG